MWRCNRTGVPWNTVQVTIDKPELVSCVSCWATSLHSYFSPGIMEIACEQLFRSGEGTSRVRLSRPNGNHNTLPLYTSYWLRLTNARRSTTQSAFFTIPPRKNFRVLASRFARVHSIVNHRSTVQVCVFDRCSIIVSVWFPPDKQSGGRLHDKSAAGVSGEH